ncbi:MAG: hypothetical protein R3B90_07140 [Planctomycetaceae bacterium]
MFRREMLASHRWLDELKVGEHAPYFYEVKKAAQWRVACAPEVVCYHVPDERTADYLAYRRRARDYFQSYLRRNGFEQYRRVAPRVFADVFNNKPPVVVLGVGHSGTSILTRMLHAAGWDPVDADRDFAESVSIRQLNQMIQKHGLLPPRRAHALLKVLPSAWAIKDPRFVMTLNHWLPHFSMLEAPPCLVRINRDPAEVVASYRRRGVRGDLPLLVEQRQSLAEQQYDRWPWSKLTIEYERLGEAAALFQPDAARRSKENLLSPRPLGSWQGLRRQQAGEPLNLGEFENVLDPADPRRRELSDESRQQMLVDDGSGETLTMLGNVLIQQRDWLEHDSGEPVTELPEDGSGGG